MKKLKPENEDDLPFDLKLDADIVSDILARLDVKTLYRLKCVSKAFHSIISDPAFVNTHRLQSMKNIKFLCESSRVCPDDEYSVVRSFYSISRQTHKRNKLSSFTFMCGHNCPITCDLVCFTSYQGICLYNPSTGELCVLPKPSTSLYNSRLGFGYSAQAREYKVVRLFPNGYAPGKRSKTKGDTKNKGMQCEIFTLSDKTDISSSSWKPLVCPRNVYRQTMSCGGRIYWQINHKTHRQSHHTLKTEELILSFDIANNTFSTLPEPINWSAVDYGNSLVFMVLDELLCITDKIRMQNTGVLDIWMLKENFSWTKVHSINLLDCIYNGTTLSPLVIKNMHPECMNGGEIIFEVEGEIIYDESDADMRFQLLMEDKLLCCVQKRTLSKIADSSFHEVGIFWQSLFPLDSGMKIQPFDYNLLDKYYH